MNYLKLILTLAAFSFSLQASAQLSDSDQEALKKTQELLTNAQQRQQAINESPEAQKVDAQVDQLVGSKQQKEQIYGVASDIFRDIATDLNGNSEKMKELLQKATQNPEGFYKALSSGQKNSIKGIADSIEKSR